jgi:putative GTP pyrophosphokinase
MKDDNNASILNQYDKEKDIYADFSNKCESLVKELLSVNRYRVHSVNSRLKARDKLESKLLREDKQYQKLAEVTDIAGVRIITHFEDEVDRIGTLVEKEFEVNAERSIDKRKLLDPDRFGYLSLHYICALNADRLKLSENHRYHGRVCEIQIRSILQHAWAEIEHDLGYKSGSTIPAPIRRRFSRLAGLLEVADQEFRSIRDELGEYQTRVEDEIRAKPSQVEIDDVSLKAFVRTAVDYRQLASTMAGMFKSKLVTLDDSQRVVSELRYVGLAWIDDLHRALMENKDLIVCQWAERMGHKTSEREIPETLPLIQLSQVLMAKKGEPALVAFFTQFGYKAPDETLEETAQKVIAAVHKCSRTAPKGAS